MAGLDIYQELQVGKVIERLNKINASKREIKISHSSKGKSIAINKINEFSSSLFETKYNNHPFFIITNLGMQAEKQRIRWPSIRYPLYKRVINYNISIFCSLLPSSKIKNFIYRSIGYEIGRNVEIAQSAFLDPFCPELISIGENTVIGSFVKLFTHAYKGQGEVIVGRINIGKYCRILGDALLGPIDVGDNSIIMLKVNTIPYFIKIEDNTIVGYEEPSIKNRQSGIKTNF